MDKPEFILAAKAMETLEMYQTFYGNSSEYHAHQQAASNWQLGAGVR